MESLDRMLNLVNYTQNLVDKYDTSYIIHNRKYTTNYNIIVISKRTKI